MGLTAREPENKGINPVSQALHHAVCYALYDLGTQYNETFGKSAHKVLIAWEIPGERITIEKNGEKLDLPRAISKQYTLSLHEKSQLRKDLESWRGKAFTDQERAGFDITTILGANCMVQVLHKEKDGKKYANVSNVVQLPKGMPKKTPENPTRYFSFEEHQDAIPEGTPDWIRDIIKASDEWQGINGGGIDERNHSVGSTAEDGDPGPSDDDSLPF